MGKRKKKKPDQLYWPPQSVHWSQNEPRCMPNAGETWDNRETSGAQGWKEREKRPFLTPLFLCIWHRHWRWEWYVCLMFAKGSIRGHVVQQKQSISGLIHSLDQYPCLIRMKREQGYLMKTYVLRWTLSCLGVMIPQPVGSLGPYTAWPCTQSTSRNAEKSYGSFWETGRPFSGERSHLISWYFLSGLCLVN